MQRKWISVDMIYIVYCFPVFRGFYVLLLLQIYCYIISLSIHNFFCKLCFSNSCFRASYNQGGSVRCRSTRVISGRSGVVSQSLLGRWWDFFLVQLADYVDRIDRVVEILAIQWPVTLCRHTFVRALWLGSFPWMTSSTPACVWSRID